MTRGEVLRRLALLGSYLVWPIGLAELLFGSLWRTDLHGGGTVGAESPIAFISAGCVGAGIGLLFALRDRRLRTPVKSGAFGAGFVTPHIVPLQHASVADALAVCLTALDRIHARHIRAAHDWAGGWIGGPTLADVFSSGLIESLSQYELVAAVLPDSVGEPKVAVSARMRTGKWQAFSRRTKKLADELANAIVEEDFDLHVRRLTQA